MHEPCGPVVHAEFEQWRQVIVHGHRLSWGPPQPATRRSAGRRLRQSWYRAVTARDEAHNLSLVAAQLPRVNSSKLRWKADTAFYG
jgi:hypothetical protein